MFSPTHTPPLESGSEDEGDLDLPDINVGTPNKKPKLEAPAAAEPNPSSARLPRLSSRGSSSSDCCASENPPPSFSPARRNSTSASTVARSLPNEEKPAASPTAAVRDNLFKSARFDVRAMVDGLRYLSPVKIDDSREINQSKKTANKVKKLARSLKEKTDLEKKLEEFRSQNGIQGISKSEEEKLAAQQMSYDRALPDMNKLLAGECISTNTSGKSPMSSTSNDGRPVFVRKPSLIGEIYPPGIAMSNGGSLAQLLVEGSGEDLQNIVCGVMLPLSYVGRACPVEVTQWLFQLTACAQDEKVSAGALRTLLELLQQSLKQGSEFVAPTVAEITDVLVTLGADKERLRPPLDTLGTVRILPQETPTSSSSPPPVRNISNLTTYVCACVKTLAGDYSVQQLEDLALVLCSLSLDPYCQYTLKQILQSALSAVLRAYPESVWSKAVTRLSPQLVCLSSHSHHHVSLACFLRGTSPRQIHLLRVFCRHCIGKIVHLNCSDFVLDKSPSLAQENKNCDTSENSPPPSVESMDRQPTTTTTSATSTNTTKERGRKGGRSGSFANTVIDSYRRAMPTKMTCKDYQELYCLLQLLNLHGFGFRTQREEQDFLRVLGGLRSTIRDDPALPITSTVKDLLIRLKVELEAQGHRGRGSTTRLEDLFSS